MFLPPLRRPETDDPRELELYEKLTQCVRCGICISTCPTYRELIEEASSPRGRIALIRALYEGEGRPIEYIRTPGRPLNPDRPVDIQIEVEA